MRYVIGIISVFIMFYSSYSQEKGLFDGEFSITGQITDFKRGFGICIALYDCQENFKKRKYTNAIRISSEKILTDTIQYEFHKVKKGEYLIAAYQDINDDKKINTNIIGIPTEPYVVYRQSAKFEWPSYIKCKFKVDTNVSGADLKFVKSGR